MRVQSINGYNYLQKQTKLPKQNKILNNEQNQFSENLNFRGKKWAILEAAVWAGVGLIAAGPIGAAAGAAIGAGIGSKMDDDASSTDDDNRPYNP